MKVIVAGDFCPENRVAHKFGECDYASVLEGIRPIIVDAHYSIVNFESTVSKGNELPINKQGRNLKCSVQGVEALKWAGFKCVTLANNHFLDYGEKGVYNTLEACTKYGIDTVGGGMNLHEASETLYKNIEGEILAVINCCEHEFSIATEQSAGSNPLNVIEQYYAIKEAKAKADYVLVVVHGGNEHYQYPSPRMQETYRFFIDAGADVVVNHHQHCYSGYELYKEKPIFYGIGNFCFDRPDIKDIRWKEGYLLEIIFLKESVNFILYPYIQCYNDEKIQLLELEQKKFFFKRIEEINNIIKNEKKLLDKYDSFVKQCCSTVEYVCEPYSNRIAISMFKRGLLPSLWTKKKKRLLLAYLQCESHFPKIIYYLTKSIK